MPIFNTDMTVLQELYSFPWSFYGFQWKHSWIQNKKTKKTKQKNVHNGDSEAVAQRCSVKKVLLEISQNALWNTCARVSFLQALDWKACNFIKKRGVFFLKKKETPTHRCFSVKFVKFLVKSILKNICERMLLFIRLWFSEINHSPCNNMKGTIDKNRLSSREKSIQ